MPDVYLLVIEIYTDLEDFMPFDTAPRLTSFIMFCSEFSAGARLREHTDNARSSIYSDARTFREF